MSVARTLLLPPNLGIFRTVYLYVGQGDATLHIVPDGTGFRYMLVDINRNPTCGGLDVVGLLEDLLPPGADGKPVLDVFLNTHPHNDHLCGVDELAERIMVGAVWHTGFTPGDRGADTFASLLALIEQVRRRGGEVREYDGTRGEELFGDVTLNILSPSPHLQDEIAKLPGHERDARIHDHCGVIRFGYGPAHRRRHVLDTGDADKDAWCEYILGPTEYHAARVKADVLSAPHHGSRTFFMHDEKDENVYRRHLELISPTYVIVSSPRRQDSPHGHPHEEALRLYRERVLAHNIHVLGERPECRIYDVYPSGEAVLWSDNGALIDEYPLTKPENDGGGSGRSLNGAPTVLTSRVDRGRPMGGGPA